MKLEKLIKDNKFEEALSLIKESKDFAPAIQSYNEAFLHFKSNELIDARYFLEKAQKLGLYTEEMSEALEVVKTSLGVKSIENSYYKEDIFMFNTVGFHQDVYFSLMGIFLLASFILIAKSKQLIGVVTLILCAGIGSFYYVIQDHHVQINQEDSVVYAGPSKIFEQKQILLPGMKIITTIEAGKWTFIKYPEVYRGWVLNQKAKKL